VTYAGWEAIDRAEKAAGEPQGRPRVKLTTTEELLEAARERVG
jgi:ferredoxin/flavodoxin---NADP+ reductase